MATAGSAVSSGEQNWKEFRETVQKVKGELSDKIHSLTKALKEVEEICDGYCKKYLSEHPLASETTEQPQNGLKQIVDTLEEDLKTAKSEDVTIVFVGQTSTGKSSLINALLRDDRLPTGPFTSTMCIFEVRPTDKKLWSVIDTVSGTILTETMNKEEVKKYLDALADEKTVRERGEQNVNSESVMQVNWPSYLCKLPEDIVLVDTPGIKENEAYDRAVANSCKKADLIVAVVDLMSPSIENVAEVLNKKQYQFKFGVFPKWDEVTKKTSETKRQQARKKREEEFQQSVEGMKEVYFVEAANASVATEETERNSGIEEFLRFERDLAERAKSVKAGKGIVLLKKAKKIASTFAKSLVEFKHTIDDKETTQRKRLERLKNEISTMEKDRDILDTAHQEMKCLDTMIRDHLSSEKIDQLIKELSNKMKNCNSEEEENKVIDEFFKKEIVETSQTLLKQIQKVEAKYKEWKAAAVQHNYGCLKNTLPSHEAKQLENPKEPKDYGYSRNEDPQTYITSDNLWAAVFGCAGATVGAIAAAPVSAVAGIVTLLQTAGVSLVVETLAGGMGTLGFGTIFGFSKLMEKLVGVGVGQRIRNAIGPSQRKMGKLEEHVRKILEEFKALLEVYTVSASEIMKQNSESISSHIEKARNRSSEEMSALEEEVQQLKVWSQELLEITNRLQDVGREFEKLKHGLEVNDTAPFDDQTENQSSA